MTLRRDRLVAAALPVFASVTMIVMVAATITAAASAGTLGYDYDAYHSALQRVLSGGTLYDVSVEFMGSSSLYFYPPTFIVLTAPLALLDQTIAVWVWTLALPIAFAASVALLPVDGRTRWLILLLGATSWPLLYAIKLGQVGPIVLLTFVVGWRWIDRPWRLGTAIAIGTAIKIQPALLFAWALVTGRRRAVAAGLMTLALLALVATIVAGPTAWLDNATLLTRVSRPIDTPHNFSPGSIAMMAGLPQGLAWAIQIANWVLVAAILVVATLRCAPVASYMAVVIATQLVSPILWDHYALVLLLPVAWLISRGHRWTVVIPLATSIVFVGAIPPVAYPLAYWVTLIMVVREGWPSRSGESRSGRQGPRDKTLPPQASREAGAILNS